MREKAEQEREEILDAAHRRAAEIEEQSRRECDRLERQGLADAERESAAERDRLLGEVREGARVQRVAYKRAAIDGVFEEAARDIEKRIGGPGWAASLAALLDEAVRFVGSGATISVADGDLPSARKWVESTSLECTATGEAASRGSVTATSSDGKRRADNGLDSRLRRVKETGSAAISRVLFAAR